MTTTDDRSPHVQVRPGVSDDLDGVSRLFFALWPEGPLAEHQAEAALILAGSPPSTMPLVVFVAEAHGVVVGFIEVGLRSHTRRVARGLRQLRHGNPATAAAEDRP